MNLKQWQTKHGINAGEYGAFRIIPDGALNKQAWREIFQLDDYGVSSYTGGAFWMMPYQP